MAVPFGFSVGDFITTLKLVRDIVTALRDSRGAVIEFRGITATLTGLESCIQQLEDLNIGDEDLNASLWSANKEFQETIDTFVDKALKFESSLRAGGSSNKLKDALRKVQWSLTQKADVEAFQTQILLHGRNIQTILLMAIWKATQADSASLMLMRSDIADIKRRMISAENTLNETRDVVQRFNNILSTCASEFRWLLRGLMRLNMALFNLVLSFRTSIPLMKAVCFDKPVTFQDAIGRRFPISLQWINCWEAFEDVLLIQHKGRPGLRAVERRYYKLQDAAQSGKWSEVDMNSPFDLAFRAGGSVDMTVIFPFETEMDDRCPKCGQPEGQIVEKSRIACQSPECQLVYSKADYVHNDVITYPAHFDIPKLEYHDDDDLGEEHPIPSDGEPFTNEQLPENSSTERQTKDEVTGTTAHSGTASSEDQLADFTNVYITRAPLVTVRDASKMWYNFPWRVVQSFEGAQSQLELFTLASNRSYSLQDRDLGHNLTAENWENLAYPGMVIEVVDASGQHAIPTSPASAPNRSTTCLLCGLRCSTWAALGRHAKTHLKSRACPVECSLCNRLAA